MIWIAAGVLVVVILGFAYVRIRNRLYPSVLSVRVAADDENKFKVAVAHVDPSLKNEEFVWLATYVLADLLNLTGGIKQLEAAKSEIFRCVELISESQLGSGLDLPELCDHPISILESETSGKHLLTIEMAFLLDDKRYLRIRRKGSCFPTQSVRWWLAVLSHLLPNFDKDSSVLMGATLKELLVIHNERGDNAFSLMNHAETVESAIRNAKAGIASGTQGP